MEKIFCIKSISQGDSYFYKSVNGVYKYLHNIYPDGKIHTFPADSEDRKVRVLKLSEKNIEKLLTEVNGYKFCAFTVKMDYCGIQLSDQYVLSQVGVDD
jgi:hypothetical protein